MTTVPVLGMDPSLTNWGLAHGHYDLGTGQIQMDTVGVVQPEKLQGKQIRNNSNDLHRAFQLASAVQAAAADARAIFVEVPHGSQSARAMASYGVCVGILGSLTAQGIQFFEVTAGEVKLATVGSKGASKQAIVSRAVNAHPNINWPYQTRKGQTEIVMGKAEHMADAIGAIEAGVQTPQFKQLLQFIQAA